jgi:hypothetical protein
VRFTGEDSLKFAKHYIYLIQALDGDDEQPHWRSITFAYIGQKLREAVSLFSRFSINDSDIQNLRESAWKYFNALALFGKVSLTVWHVGFVAPLHTSVIFQKFGYGLGLNGMQGREAKHQRIKSYASFSTKACRWQTVFRHEYVHTIWLKENQNRKYPSARKKYDDAMFMKNGPENDHTICPNCGLEVPCRYCENEIWPIVEKCVVEANISERMKIIMEPK